MHARQLFLADTGRVPAVPKIDSETLVELACSIRDHVAEVVAPAHSVVAPSRPPLDLFERGFVQEVVYRPRVLGQWFDGIRIYAAASSPTRSRRTCAGLR